MGVIALWLGLGGTALIASPIIIHLLNRRRYKIVEWAAMDFLLLAEKRNRRRVRMEDLILLLLRCLAIMLIAWAISRVFMSTGNTAVTVPGQSLHRVIIVDDSPSMGQQLGDTTVMLKTQSSLVDMLREIANDNPGDTITLLLTSNPDEPLIEAETIDADRVTAFVDRVQAMEVHDVDARWQETLTRARDIINSGEAASNNELYIFSDFRNLDWSPQGDKGPNSALIEEISENATGVNLIDVPADADPGVSNLGIVSIEPGDGEKRLAAGVTTEFLVTVKNYGQSEVSGAELSLTPEGGVTQTNALDTIAAGKTVVSKFQVIFEAGASESLQVEIKRPDELLSDNIRYYAAELTEGTRVLLVDGARDISRAEYSETFYLDNAVDPITGRIESGNIVVNRTEDEFRDVNIFEYDIIFLANVARIETSRIEELRDWVAGGGGLIIFMGENTISGAYDDMKKQGLFPLNLGVMMGDAEREVAMNMEVQTPGHPIMQLFVGDGGGLVDLINFFRWWEISLTEEAIKAENTQVLATVGEQPLLLDHRLGRGKVLIMNTTADIAWSSLPGTHLFLPLVQLMISSALAPPSEEVNLPTGSAISLILDPSDYEETVRIVPPDETEAFQRDARYEEIEQPDPVNPELTTQSTKLVIDLDGTQMSERGIYKIELTRLGVGTESKVYAMNLANTESNLERVPEDELKTGLSEVRNLQYFAGSAPLSATGARARTELWPYLLTAALLCLALELGLGWYFGSRR